jgi:hypothetical protein
MIDREVKLIAVAFAVALGALLYQSKQELAPTPAPVSRPAETWVEWPEDAAYPPSLDEPSTKKLVPPQENLWHRTLAAARADADSKDIVIYFAAGSSEAHGGQQPPPIPEGAVGVLLFANDPWNENSTTVADAWRLGVLPAFAVERDGGLIHPPTELVGELSEALEKLSCDP